MIVRILLGFPELAWTIVGSIWVFGGHVRICPASDPEDWTTLRVVQGLVVFNWILVLLFLIGVMMVFDPLGHHHSASEGALLASEEGNGRSTAATLEMGFEQRTRLWEWRCKFLCCSCCSSKFPL